MKRMLRCFCEIYRPFTHVSTKKVYILRVHSVGKTPSECYCSFGRNVCLSSGRKRQFTNREWDVRKALLKDQKSFIWTSFLFFKDKNKDKGLEVSDGESNSAHPKHTESKAKILGSSQSSSPNDNVSQNQFFRASSVKDNTLNDNNKGPTKFPETAVAADKDKTKNLSGLESKVLVTPLEVERVSSASDAKVSKEKTILDSKRSSKEVSLGNVGSESKLEEPPGVLNSETGRLTEEIKLFKEAPQKGFIDKAKTYLKKSPPNVQEETSRVTKLVNLGSPKGDVSLSSTARRRQTVDLNKSSTERNFITPVRAMTDFLLKPSDLEGLRKTKRRSPYENDPPITVYWRKDVEAKAIEVWGSKENLLKEILKRDIERRRYQQNLFTVKRRLRDYRREQGRETEIKSEQNGLFGSSGKVVLTAIAMLLDYRREQEQENELKSEQNGLLGSSGKTVLTAITINGTNFMFKILAWIYTGSHSMFSEALHSLADTINQLILAYGIHKSVQRADSDHPYGYTNMRYVASLISGVGIFCVGSGLSMYHGFVGLTSASDIHSFYWAYFILGGSLLSEGATLLVAFNSIMVGAKKNEMSLTEYILRGQDPSVNVVLLEDLAAVIGVGFAGSCMGLSNYYESHIPDAIGSFLVGGLLAGVASFIIYTNVTALVGRSIPQERLDKINAELESDVMIRAIHDVKGIDIGNSLVRYKAEMDFDGGELTRSYLDKQDLNQMLEEVKKMQTIDELEEFMLKHGENIVDMMGGEIDRIELKLRKKHPEIRHCDLEIL